MLDSSVHATGPSSRLGSDPLHRLLNTIDVPFDLSPLISAIQESTAVVYVGAGASVPAGLPTWNVFLQQCLARAQKSMPDPAKWHQTARLLREGDYLTGADLLQKEIGQALEHYVWDVFGHADVPSPIHLAISRLPFSLAVTTNYDRLLESSYPARPNVWTWRDPAALFSALKHRRFSVVKVHGDVGNGPSLVLTKTQYRDLMHLNKSFNECLSILLSLKTFLFVGSSLRDHDLLRLMDNAKITYGNDFGPHYAILFEDEVDVVFSRMLSDAYNINVIKCRRPENAIGDWRTEAVCSTLKDICGRVASILENPPLRDILDDPLFNLREASQALLPVALDQLGATSARIAFVRDTHTPGLYAVATSTPGVPELANVTDGVDVFHDSSRLIAPHSLLGQLFMDSSTEACTCYRRNIRQNSPVDGLTFASPLDSRSRSVLASAVMCDRSAVGTIDVESPLNDAFSEDHLTAILRWSSLAGSVYREYRHRVASTRSIVPFLQNMSIFQQLMDMSRALAPLKLSYLLYEIDYASGLCHAKMAPGLLSTEPSQRFGGLKYHFSESSLVTLALKSQSPVTVSDAQEELSRGVDSRLSPIGVARLGITGTVFACPVRVQGRIATVLVCWSRCADKRLMQNTRRVEKLAQLIGNAPQEALGTDVEKSAAFNAINAVNEALYPIDKGKEWDKSENNQEFQRSICKAILKGVLHASTGILRVRLWERHISNGVEYFRVAHSAMVEDVASRMGKDAIDSYVGIETLLSDQYCAYTIRRTESGFSNAIWQDSRIFGVDDPNSAKLDKATEGGWIVAPICRGKKLFGFLSADNHEPNAEGIMVERPIDESRRIFQCCALDLAADVLVTIFRVRERFRARTKRGVPTEASIAGGSTHEESRTAPMRKTKQRRVPKTTR
jgi:hypothetical protein